MERKRNRGSFANYTRSSFWWNTTQNPKPAPIYSTVTGGDGEVLNMRDFVVSNFKARQKAGEVFNNLCSRIREVRTLQSVGPKFSKTFGAVTYWGELLGPWGTTMPSLSVLSGRDIPSYSDALTEVTTRALSRVDSPDYMGLVALGEFRETLSYLRNPFKQALKIVNKTEKRVKVLDRKIDSLERKASQADRNLQIQLLRLKASASDTPVLSDRKRAAIQRLQNRKSVADSINKAEMSRVLKEVEGTYLELRYALRPLVGDVINLLEAIDKKQVRPIRQTYRAGDKLPVHNDSWVIPETFSGITYNAIYTYKREVQSSVGLLYEFKTQQSTFEKFGLAVGQVPAVWWELVPLSFVADRFLNIGQYISAITPVIGATRIAEWTTTIITETIAIERKDWKYSDWTTSTPGTGVDTYVRTTYHRSPHIVLPGIVVKGKALDALKDVAFVTDLAAILHQKVRGLSTGTGQNRLQNRSTR